MSAGASMDILLAGLLHDHATFAKVLDLMERESSLAATHGTADLELLLIAADYLSGYPVQYHHPLEDAVCERLKKSRPAVAPIVDGIIGEHKEVAARLTRFKTVVNNVIGGKAVSRDDFVQAASEFVRAERGHMKRENEDLLPAAQAVLKEEDWARLRARFAGKVDPLSAPAANAQLERLRQALLPEPGPSRPRVP